MLKKQKKSSETKMQKKLDPQMFDDAVLTWKAPEYLHHEKSRMWYVIALLVVAGLVWYGLATDGWTFSLAVVVCAGTYYLFQHRVPEVVDIKLSDAGVKIGEHRFAYSAIRGFWIVHELPHANKIYIRMRSKLHPDLSVSLDDADPVQVQKILVQHVPELKGKLEPFADTLVRLFRL